MLTGDKVETAINIARSCKLLTPKMDEHGLLRLDVSDRLSDGDATEATKQSVLGS